jgi:O-antigen/teichoic acid export membrane protein
MSAFGPVFSSLMVRGDSATVTFWVEQLLKILTASAILAAAFAYAFSTPIVHIALGAGFEPVARQLLWMGIAGVLFVPGCVSRLLVVTLGKPRISIASAALQLVVFAALCIVLVPRDVTVGASIAVVVATAVFSAHSTWCVRELLEYSLKPWSTVMALGIGCSPLIWAWDVNGLVGFGVFCVVFVIALARTGILTVHEFTHLWKAARQ